jgi:S-formylglutathione hydrolase FrmB/lysophospholipase L1-like esterase
MSTTVADIYRVLDLRVRSVAPPAGVALGVWLSAAALFAWSAPDLKAFVAARDAGAVGDAALSVAVLVEQGAERAGVLALRRAVDGAVKPFKRPSAILGRKAPPKPEPPPPAPVQPAPAVDLAPRGPGAGWVGPADPGGGRVSRVLLVGASSIQYYLGTELERLIEAEYPGVEVHRVGKLGTGLVRDDVFDWAAEIRALQAEHRPDLVLLQFGGNDAQPILVGDRKLAVGATGWDEAYHAKITSVNAQVVADGALPVWIGMPVMRDPGFTKRIERVNRVTREAAEAGGGRYVSMWDLAANADGSYRVEVEHEGRRTLMRLEDGVHFTRPAAQYLAEALVIRLEQHAPLVRGQPPHAVAIHRRIRSEARGKEVPYLAFVPREVPPQGLPALVLLHGAWGSWTDWSDNAHRDLQRLASEHRMILVLPDGDPFGWYLDSDRVPGARVHTFLVDELPVALSADLPFDGRLSMMGLSMGGHGALTVALARPDLLRSASSISGALDLPHAKSRSQLQDLLGTYDAEPEAWHAWSVLHRIRAAPQAARAVPLKLTVGSADKTWVGASRSVHAALDELGVAHAYTEVEGGHTWDVWTGALADHVGWHAAQLQGD